VGKATAKRLLKKHPDQSGCSYTMCAIAIRGNKLISHGFNSLKTDPMPIAIARKRNVPSMYEHSKDHYISPHLHAEVAALKKAGITSGIDTIIVLRVSRSGSFAIAKPCQICQAVLREHGVKKVIYSVEDGLETVELN
jgi:deoxycytidylate deaminase